MAGLLTSRVIADSLLPGAGSSSGSWLTANRLQLREQFRIETGFPFKPG